MFFITKLFVRTAKGAIVSLDRVIDDGVGVVNKKLDTLKNKLVSRNLVTFELAKSLLRRLELEEVDSKINSALLKTKVRAKKWYQSSKKYGYLIAGDVLIELGESTTDDEIITAIVVSACVAAVSSMSGPIGGVATNVVTSSTLKPILLGAFKYLDKYQVKLGKKLVEKGSIM